MVVSLITGTISQKLEKAGRVCFGSQLEEVACSQGQENTGSRKRSDVSASTSLAVWSSSGTLACEIVPAIVHLPISFKPVSKLHHRQTLTNHHTLYLNLRQNIQQKQLRGKDTERGEGWDVSIAAGA